MPPVPVVARVRTFPAIAPNHVGTSEPFPDRVIIPEACNGPDGRAVCGSYLGDGPDVEEVGGRFLGPAAPTGFVPPGPGPLRDVDNFLDRVIWRPMYESRFGFVSWDPATFFSSLAYTFKKRGAWAVVFTDPDPAGGRFVNYYRSPIVFEPRTDGQVGVKFGPRKKPDKRDFGADGRQYPGRFLELRRVVSGLVGERVEDLSIACQLFDVKPPPPGPATPETLPARTWALRELYRAVRAEAELWP